MMIKTKFLLVLGFIIAMAASPNLLAQQYARPDATTNAAGWTVVNAATHHEALDEVAADDNDYIDSGDANISTVILGLGNVTDPGTYANNHILRYRCQSTGGKGGAEECNAALYEGATLIFDTGTNSATRDAFASHQFTISDASGITDYTNLSIQLTPVVGNGESIQISWAELEVPDSTITPATVATPTSANVTGTTATLGGTMSNDNGTAVTDCGVEWGTSDGGPYPSSQSYDAGVCISNGGVFTAGVNGLTASTIYFFRTWADNGARGYSPQASFTSASPPTVTVATPTSITQNSALLGGDVTLNGGATVTERGIVWNTSSPAETGGTLVPNGAGLGTFSEIVSGLPAGTDIYVKAYATNSVGTAYSAVEELFTTLAGSPTVTQDVVTPLTATSASFTGHVTSDGGGGLTEWGTVWSTSPNPTTADNRLAAGSVPPDPTPTIPPTLDFTHTVTVTAGQIIYYRAYAINAQDTAYSSELNFSPTGSPELVADPPAAASVTHNSAVLGGEITLDGGSPILERGTVWNTSANPDETHNKLAQGGTDVGVPFSHTRTGLPAGTQIYYRSYARNAVGYGFSANDGLFTTATEPTVQASNITFPNAAGRSMRISWTRGNGDGSIVIMREDPPNGIEVPVDATDYAATGGYGDPTLELSTGNFVVYKGSGNLVLVTDLVESTTYSVAVYEYAGTGASTDYLQLNPAVASQVTTDTRVHNEDNRVNCSDCHQHGSWSPNNAELKVACDVCHTALGEAPAKLMFDNHLTPSKNPAIDFVACGFCHELHNPGGANTTSSFNVVTGVTQNNKSFLRANVDKYVPTAVTPAYLHTDQPLRETGNPNGDLEALADTPDRAVEGGTDVTATPDDTEATGYCQVCHSLTNNHRSTDTAGSNQLHDGEANDSDLGSEVNCGTCHQHNNKFIGVGGSVTCVECHDSPQDPLPRPTITTQFDRLSSHIGPQGSGSATVTQEDCLVCHDQGGHQSQIVRLWDADTGSTSFAQLTPGAPTTDPAEGEQFEGHCLSCHDDGSADSLPPYAGDSAGQTDTSPFNGSGAPPIIDETAWIDAAHNRSVLPIVSCVGACHGSGHGSDQDKLLAPAVGAKISATDFCYTCHDGTLPPAADIQAQFNTATNFRADSGSGALVNQRHDISNVPDDTVYPYYTDGDQTYSGGAVSCKDCHSPHVDNATNPVSDPDTNLPLATYDITNTYTEDGKNLDYDLDSTLDPINPQGSAGGFTEPDYIQFCLTCHDNSPSPTSATMSPSLLDIGTNYATDYHGAGTGSGQGASLNKGGMKVPWVTTDGIDPTGFYAAMNCTTCHGAHGSDNIFNLRSSITVAGVQMSIGGTGNMPIPARITDPTVYTLPPMDGRNVDEATGLQEDHYWGAWCSFCHDMSTHAGKAEDDSCLGGHMHGGGSF